MTIASHRTVRCHFSSSEQRAICICIDGHVYNIKVHRYCTTHGVWTVITDFSYNSYCTVISSTPLPHETVMSIPLLVSTLLLYLPPHPSWWKQIRITAEFRTADTRKVPKQEGGRSRRQRRLLFFSFSTPHQIVSHHITQSAGHIPPST